MENLGLGGQLKKVISTVSLDKNLDKNVIIEALEHAVMHAARRTFGTSADLEAQYNEESDEIELFQFRTVVEHDDVDNPYVEIDIEEAKTFDENAEIGDSIGVKIDTNQFGRIAAQSAKQIIMQKVRDAERAQVYEEFKDRVGEILSGVVRRFERNDIIVDLGRAEAVIPYKEQIPTERFKVKDRIQACVIEIKRSSRGPQIVMSRAHTGFLVKLFAQTVSEIYDGIVTIEAAARDPGFRSKVAVYSRDASVDPVGACIGQRRQRVQSVVNELNGEKIDIIQWDKDPAKFVCNTLRPAAVSKVIVDNTNHSMEVIVPDDQLSLAIGKKGQNVKLAAQLTGWRLDIKSEAKLEEQMQVSKQVLADLTGLGIMHAEILANEGIKNIEELSQLNVRTLVRLINLEESEAERILALSQELVATGKYSSPKAHGNGKPASEADEFSANAVAAPEVDHAKNFLEEERQRRIEVFMHLSAVGEASAHSLADAGYATIGDVLADSAEEVAQKTGLPISIAKTIQIAADRYLQGGVNRN